MNDLHAVNSELDWPKWWEHLIPTIEQMCQQIPEWVEFYAGENVSNAYEGMQLAAGSAHMVTYNVSATNAVDLEHVHEGRNVEVGTDKATTDGARL